MALRNQPYLPLYVQDYLTDEKLNECSASAQGIYIKIMCIMHKSDPYGSILLKQKDKQKDKQTINFAYKVAKHLPFTVTEVEDALEELLFERVLFIDGDLLCQKRMIKDNDISIKRSSAGKIGGNKTHFAKAKTKTNNIANSENEYEYDNVINKEGVKIKPEFEKFIKAAFQYLGKDYVCGNPATGSIESNIRRWLLTTDPRVQTDNLNAYLSVTEKRFRVKNINSLLEKLTGYNYTQDTKQTFTVPQRIKTEEEIKAEKEGIADMKRAYKRLKAEAETNNPLVIEDKTLQQHLPA